MNLEVKDTFNQFKIGVLLLADGASDEVIATVTAVQHYTDQIVVVVLSTGLNGEIINNIPVNVIDYTGAPLGKAMKQGFDHLQSNGCQYVITLPVKEGYHVDDVERFASSIVNDTTIIAGTREGRRSFGTILSDFWCKVETGHKIRDTQCLYRLYPLNVAAVKRLYSFGSEVSTELLVRTLWHGVEVASLPLSTSHRSTGSIMKVLRACVLHLILLSIAFLYIKPRDFFRRLKKKTSGRFSTTCFSVRMSLTS